MNIFVVDPDPRQAARDLCDRHVVKMPLECAQLLSVPFARRSSTGTRQAFAETLTGHPGAGPYALTHVRHPCALWVCASRANYAWLVAHARGLLEEYQLRFGREHASGEVVEWCAAHVGDRVPDVQGTVPPAVVGPTRPDVSGWGDVVLAYRELYQTVKARFARWECGRAAPAWWSA